MSNKIFKTGLATAAALAAMVTAAAVTVAVVMPSNDVLILWLPFDRR